MTKKHLLSRLEYCAEQAKRNADADAVEAPTWRYAAGVFKEARDEIVRLRVELEKGNRAQ